MKKMNSVLLAIMLLSLITVPVSLYSFSGSEFDIVNSSYNKKNKFKIKKEGSKYGVLDELGNEFIACEYDAINTSEFGEDLYFYVVKEKKQGIFDELGNEFIACEYDSIKYVNGKFEAKLGKTKVFFDELGNEI